MTQLACQKCGWVGPLTAGHDCTGAAPLRAQVEQLTKERDGALHAISEMRVAIIELEGVNVPYAIAMKLSAAFQLGGRILSKLGGGT